MEGFFALLMWIFLLAIVGSVAAIMVAGAVAIVKIAIKE